MFNSITYNRIKYNSIAQLIVTRVPAIIGIALILDQFNNSAVIRQSESNNLITQNDTTTIIRQFTTDAIINTNDNNLIMR